MSRVTMQVKVVVADTETVREQQDISFRVGDGEVCDALECATLEMRRKEEAYVRCMQPDWCSGGVLNLPKNLAPPILIHVLLVDFTAMKDRWEMDDGERIERCRVQRERAAALYKSGRIRLAAHHYDVMASFFEAVSHFRDPEDQKAGKELRRLAQLNRAQCALRLGDPRQAKTLCTTVLKEDGASTKALFRRASASIDLKEYNEAIIDLQRLLDIEPGTEAQQLMRKARRFMQEADKKQMPVYSKMCNALGTLPERETVTRPLASMPDHLRLCRTEFQEPAPQERSVVGEQISAVETTEADGEEYVQPRPDEHCAGTGEAPATHNPNEA